MVIILWKHYTSEQRIQKNLQEIENHKAKRANEGKEPDESYIRLTNAKISKDQRLTSEKIEELRNHQELSFTYILEGVIFVSQQDGDHDRN